MTPKKLVATLLAGTAMLASTSALAEPIKVHHYYYADDDDEDEDDDRDDWKGRRDHPKEKKRKHGSKHGYYRNERPPVVIYAPPPDSPKPRVNPGQSFPRESAAERAAAKERQREILEKELAAEQQLLADAKRRLDDQTARNHQRNTEALRRELRNLER
jgi:hypothetical protein